MAEMDKVVKLVINIEVKNDIENRNELLRQ